MPGEPETRAGVPALLGHCRSSAPLALPVGEDLEFASPHCRVWAPHLHLSVPCNAKYVRQQRCRFDGACVLLMNTALHKFPVQYAAVVSAPDSESLRTAALALSGRDESQLSAPARVAALKHIRAACRAAADVTTPAPQAVQPASGTAQQADVRLEQLVAEVR